MSTGQAEKFTQALEKISGEIYGFLAGAFPVCTASDEFHYFPQAIAESLDWSRWDDFSAGAVKRAAERLAGFIAELDKISSELSDPDDLIDAAMLARTLKTLSAELGEVRLHELQPTFHLTVAGIGLAEAVESRDPTALDQRLGALPAFLEAAAECIKEPPALFRDMGVQMAQDTRAWIESLQSRSGLTEPALTALDVFETHLRSIRTREDYRLPTSLLERVVKDHIGCGAGVSEVMAVLEHEVERRKEILADLAGKVLPGGSWEDAVESMEPDPLPDGGLLELYCHEIENLANHCLEAGLVTDREFDQNPVQVAPVPSYLSAMRSAAAYSMPPGHPPSGGTFYVLETEALSGVKKILQRDYRMLAAHETYPGHHLLDLNRWSLERALRRPLEFPLFYEGWACFAEELMAMTGYFCKPGDLLLLNRRHLWRAVRGRVDLGIQTGEMDLEGAAQTLEGAGMPADLARSATVKYALKPGYQVCYAFGLVGFERAFERSGLAPAGFARKILAQGEIGFEGVKAVLQRK